MRGKSLVSLLNSLRGEARLSLNPAHNAQVRDSHVQLLQRTQEWLWEDFNWPHLRVERDIPLAAGQRYYDMPEDLAVDRIEMIELRYNGRWMKLSYGIEPQHYVQYDSDLAVRGYPVERWRLTEDEQIEVHPISDSDAVTATLEGTLRITGIRNLNPLVADDDTADLDNRLLTMYAAAELLAASGAKDAQLKLSQANKLYAKLRSALTDRTPFKMFGQAEEKRSPLRGPPSIYYRVED